MCRPGARITRVVLSGVLALAVPEAAAAAQPTPPDWERWLPLPGVIDVAGPRADGSLVAAAGRLYYLISLDGTTTPVGPPSSAPAALTAIALSPGLGVAAAGCVFSPGEIFALEANASPPGVLRLSPGGDASRFADLPQLESLTGIGFDSTGRFDNRLLVAGRRGERTIVLALDCRGRTSAITEDGPHLDGGIAVAPQRFGDYGGDLIGVDEHTGEVVFVRADATSGVVVSTGLAIAPDVGARSLGFVPEGFNRRGGSAYVADSADGRSSPPGSGSLRRLSSEALAPIGIDDNDLLVAGGAGGQTAVVRCREGCRVLALGRAPDGVLRGRIAMVLDRPAPPVKPPANPAGSRVFVVVTGVLILGGYVLFLRHRSKGANARQEPEQTSSDAESLPGAVTEQ